MEAQSHAAFRISEKVEYIIRKSEVKVKNYFLDGLHVAKFEE